MTHNSDGISCTTCGRIIHSGEGRISVALTVAELADLAYATPNPSLRRRLICAIDLLDHDLAAEILSETKDRL